VASGRSGSVVKTMGPCSDTPEVRMRPIITYNPGPREVIFQLITKKPTCEHVDPWTNCPCSYSRFPSLLLGTSDSGKP